jgi:hypothetical protein
MSTKKTLKRLALVAISAMGFGLLSVAPAKADAVVVKEVTSWAAVAVGTPSDSSLVIGAATQVSAAVTTGGSEAGAVYSQTIYTQNATLPITDLKFEAGGVTNGDEGVLSIGAGNAAAQTGAGARVSPTLTAASTKLSWTPDDATDNPDGLPNLTASTSGTVYTIWHEAATAGLTTTAGAKEGYLLLTVVRSTAQASVATLGTSTTTYAGRVGQQVSISPTATVLANTTADGTVHPQLRIATAITSQPSVPSGQSVVYPKIAAENLTGYTYADVAGATTLTQTGDTSGVTSTGSATVVASIDYSAKADVNISAVTSETKLATVTFTPVATGVYTLVVWNESGASGNAALSGSESFQTFTINVVSDVTTIALSATNSTAKVDASGKGSLIKVSLKDAGGNIAIPATGQSVVLTPSGSALIKEVNDSAVSSAAGAAYSLSAADFGQTGTAWVNIANGTAETVTITATYAGSASASVSLTFRTTTNLVDAAATDLAPAPYSSSGAGYEYAGTTTGTASIPVGTVTTTYVLNASYSETTAKYLAFRVTDTDGRITGVAGLDWVAAATVGSTGVASYNITATTSAVDANIYTVTSETANAAGTRVTTTSSVATTTGALTATPTVINAVAGATNKIKVSLVDNFSRELANTTVTATVTGRNPTTVAKSAVTDALGNASFSFTDANTTSVIASDTITLTPSGGTAITVTILYGAANAPATITLTSTGDTDVIPGTTTTDIDASATGATGKYATASAVVKNSAGSAVSGVPVTFTVTGLVGAEVHTTKVTVYTDVTGKAVSYISSYAAGKATVTATAGTATASDDIYFKQQTITEARTIAVAATGGLVTATVKDRYGNVIEGVNVYATRTGTGYFGSGASTASGKTDKNGQVEFNFVGSGTVTVQLGDATAASATYGQSYAAAGYDKDAVNGTAIDTYVAGTDAEDQEGLGGSLSPAGVNSASVAVTAADAAATAAESAADAAAEAIDAANAATDAANLAAEAADAATVAAEEARDAADAATAAVEELATQVATLMAALKAQITTLANTVAKIAKKVKA